MDDSLFHSVFSSLHSMETASAEEKVKLATNLKELGNEFYKAGDFDSAYLVYDSVLDTFLSNNQMAEMGHLKCRSLLDSCFLNLSACSLKLQRYEETISLCHHIVSMDGMSAKAFYRRGQAHFHLGNLEAAVLDMERVVQIEPQNKTVKREFELLKEQQKPLFFKEGAYVAVQQAVHSHLKDALMLENGSSITSSKALSSSTSGRGVIDDVSLFQNEFMELPLQGNNDAGCSYVKAACRDADVPSNTNQQCADWSLDNRSCKTEFGREEASQNLIKESNGGEEEVVMCDVQISEDSEDTKMEFQVDDDPQRHDDKNKVYEFVNRRNHSSSIHISRCDVNNLLKGKQLSYFNSGSFSVMTVRIITPVKPNMKEATQDDDLGSAASTKLSFPCLSREQDLPLPEVVRSDEVSSLDNRSQEVIRNSVPWDVMKDQTPPYEPVTRQYVGLFSSPQQVSQHSHQTFPPRCWSNFRHGSCTLAHKRQNLLSHKGKVVRKPKKFGFRVFRAGIKRKATSVLVDFFNPPRKKPFSSWLDSFKDRGFICNSTLGFSSILL